MSRSRLAAVPVAFALAVALNASAVIAGKGGGPSAPTNLRITAATDTSVSLAWDPSTKKSGTFWYCLQNHGQGCIRVDPPKTSIVRTGLLPNTTFVFTVYAIDQAGNRSASSNPVSYTTPADTTAPSPAPVLSTTGVFPTRISLSWTRATDNLSQVWYTLFHDGVAVSANQIGFQSATFFYLEPQSTHTFRVDARDASMNTVQSNTLTVTTPARTDTTPPSAPTDLHLTFQSNSEEAWIEWTPSTDDTDSQALILYETYLDGVLTMDGVVGGTNTIAYCRGTGPMEIVLRAVDTSGNRSGPSNAIVWSC